MRSSVLKLSESRSTFHISIFPHFLITSIKPFAPLSPNFKMALHYTFRWRNRATAAQTTPYRIENSQRQTHASCSGRLLQQQLLWAKLCQHFATEVTRFHSAVALSKGKAIAVNLFSYVITTPHLFAASSGSSYDWLESMSSKTQRKHFSSLSTTTTTPTELGFSGKFLSLLRLFLAFTNLGKTLNLHDTPATQSDSLSRGI